MEWLLFIIHFKKLVLFFVTHPFTEVKTCSDFFFLITMAGLKLSSARSNCLRHYEDFRLITKFNSLILLSLLLDIGKYCL